KGVAETRLCVLAVYVRPKVRLHIAIATGFARIARVPELVVRTPEGERRNVLSTSLPSDRRLVETQSAQEERRNSVGNRNLELRGFSRDFRDSHVGVVYAVLVAVGLGHIPCCCCCLAEV